jgi:hypothetical protein
MASSRVASTFLGPGCVMIVFRVEFVGHDNFYSWFPVSRKVRIVFLARFVGPDIFES